MNNYLLHSKRIYRALQSSGYIIGEALMLRGRIAEICDRHKPDSFVRQQVEGRFRVPVCIVRQAEPHVVTLDGPAQHAAACELHHLTLAELAALCIQSTARRTLTDEQSERAAAQASKPRRRASDNNDIVSEQFNIEADIGSAQRAYQVDVIRRAEGEKVELQFHHIDVRSVDETHERRSIKVPAYLFAKEFDDGEGAGRPNKYRDGGKAFDLLNKRLTAACNNYWSRHQQNIVSAADLERLFGGKSNVLAFHELRQRCQRTFYDASTNYRSVLAALLGAAHDQLDCLERQQQQSDFYALFNARLKSSLVSLAPNKVRAFTWFDKDFETAWNNYHCFPKRNGQLVAFVVCEPAAGSGDVENPFNQFHSAVMECIKRGQNTADRHVVQFVGYIVATCQSPENLRRIESMVLRAPKEVKPKMREAYYVLRREFDYGDADISHVCQALLLNTAAAHAAFVADCETVDRLIHCPAAAATQTLYDYCIHLKKEEEEVVVKEVVVEEKIQILAPTSIDVIDSDGFKLLTRPSASIQNDSALRSSHSLTTTSVPLLIQKLIDVWPFQTVATGKRVTQMDAAFFDVAAIVGALSSRTHLDGIKAKICEAKPELNARTVKENLELLLVCSKRGMIDENVADDNWWSLERAIRQGIVAQPSRKRMYRLRDQFEDDALIQSLQVEWSNKKRRL